jgi:hypothetical protein
MFLKLLCNFALSEFKTSLGYLEKQILSDAFITYVVNAAKFKNQAHDQIY